MGEIGVGSKELPRTADRVSRLVLSGFHKNTGWASLIQQDSFNSGTLQICNIWIKDVQLKKPRPRFQSGENSSEDVCYKLSFKGHLLSQFRVVTEAVLPEIMVLVHVSSFPWVHRPRCRPSSRLPLWDDETRSTVPLKQCVSLRVLSKPADRGGVICQVQIFCPPAHAWWLARYKHKLKSPGRMLLLQGLLFSMAKKVATVVTHPTCIWQDIILAWKLNTVRPLHNTLGWGPSRN